MRALGKIFETGWKPAPIEELSKLPEAFAPTVALANYSALLELSKLPEPSLPLRRASNWGGHNQPLGSNL
jgi:hypothetical protein